SFFCRAGDTRVQHSVESVAVPARGRWPLVVTAHDVCALLRPDLVSPRLARLKRITWRRAVHWDRVIVPSRATKTDVEGLGIPAERVTMIRHGAPALDRARVAPVPTLEQRVRGLFPL